MANLKFKYLEVIRLNYDNGTKGKFRFLDLVELNEETYIVLLPDGSNGTIVHIYKLENLKSKATLRYLPVQDKEVENKVLNIYNKGEHNYLNRNLNSNSLKSNPLISIIIFLVIMITSSIILGFKIGFLPQEELLYNLIFVGMMCAITGFPSAIVTGIICGIFNLKTIHVDPNFARNISAIVELENQANYTKDPVLAAQLRAKAQILRNQNK